MTLKYQTLLSEHQSQIDELNIKLNKSIIEQEKHIKNYNSLFEDFENYKKRAQTSLKKQRDYQGDSKLADFISMDEYHKIKDELAAYKEKLNELNGKLQSEM